MILPTQLTDKKRYLIKLYLILHVLLDLILLLLIGLIIFH